MERKSSRGLAGGGWPGGGGRLARGLAGGLAGVRFIC